MALHRFQERRLVQAVAVVAVAQVPQALLEMRQEMVAQEPHQAFLVVALLTQVVVVVAHMTEQQEPAVLAVVLMAAVKMLPEAQPLLIRAAAAAAEVLIRPVPMDLQAAQAALASLSSRLTLHEDLSTDGH
jgi:hypothetical protein